MRSLILLFIISLGMTSCMTEQKCNRKYPTKIEIHDSIIYKTKTITLYDTIFIKADTIQDIDTVYYNPITGLINSNRIYANSDYSSAWAQVINSNLYLELIQNDTAISNMLEANIKIKEVYKTKVIYVNKYIHHWYDKPSYFIAILFILAVLIMIVMKVIKMYIKPF